MTDTLIPTALWVIVATLLTLWIYARVRRLHPTPRHDILAARRLLGLPCDAVLMWWPPLGLGMIALVFFAPTPVALPGGAIAAGYIGLELFVLRGKRLMALLADVREREYLICPECLYSLRGLPSTGSCPECARPYRRARLEEDWCRKIARARRSVLVPFVGMGNKESDANRPD